LDFQMCLNAQLTALIEQQLTIQHLTYQ
jgi:hypothetical protein